MTDGPSAPAEDEQGLDALLEYLHRNRGFDFTGYKRASLTRRIRRRMQLVSITDFRAYLDHLEVHPTEFPQLFNTLLINVTSFFRDPSSWSALQARLPAIVEVDGDRPIRVWSAGCSTGEEPYTLAMVLCELLGTEAFLRRVKVYATDVDDDALTTARLAMYSSKTLESLPPELLAKYFVPAGASFTFQPELRRAVIFGRHDLVQDAPIPRVDVLACRNTLMYFNAEAQTRILGRLQFALNPRGIMMLGKAELLLTHADLFTPLDLKQRLFGRASKSLRPRERAAVEPPAVPVVAVEDRSVVERGAFEVSPLAQIVVDGNGRLALTNARARRVFGLHDAQLGKPFHELELSYRPAELRSCIEEAGRERRAVQLRGVERENAAGEKAHFDIDVVPVISEKQALLGVQVSFADVSQTTRLELELRKTNEELAALHEELQSTSEELETTNEELQSTVEELETTNEELQSTNEELEAMNEELQSTNEELQTINEELRLRGVELNEVNAFHAAVLGSLRNGIVVLDRNLLVQTWNEAMRELWGLRADEVIGKHFLNLDLGLPVDELASAIRTCIASGEDAERRLACTNRRGKSIECRVGIVPLRDDGTKGVVVLVEAVS